jgi:hypothetical protein
MFNVQDFKNATIAGNNLILLIDDANDSFSFGFTDTKTKVLYNLKILENIIKSANLDDQLEKSKKGLTTLFPLGRYIVILEISKDKSKMTMTFFDFRVEYSKVDKMFKGLFSDNLIAQFKNIKYQMEDYFNDSLDKILLDLNLEPPEE